MTITTEEDDILVRFSDGIKKFNDEDFYECHDVLEDVWFDIRGNSRRFYQGLIHLAVGFYHIIGRENPNGALSQLNKGVTKLQEYTPDYQGVELKNLIEKVLKCIEEIEKIKKGEVKEFKKRLIPKINFQSDKFKGN